MKALSLTAEGIVFCEKNIVPVLEAEENAFSSLSQEEREKFVSTSNKYNALLVKNFSKLL